jgi:hypothetical protein
LSGSSKRQKRGDTAIQTRSNGLSSCILNPALSSKSKVKPLPKPVPKSKPVITSDDDRDVEMENGSAAEQDIDMVDDTGADKGKGKAATDKVR